MSGERQYRHDGCIAEAGKKRKEKVNLINSIVTSLALIGERRLIASYCSIARDQRSSNTMQRTPERDSNTSWTG